MIELGCGTAVAIRVHSAAPNRDAPLVLHLHGGAFQAGAAGCGHTVATLLADAGAVVVSADYPAGREHPFPAALEVAYALLQRLYKDRARWAGRTSKLFVAGEEAGGNLAAAVAMMARDRHGPPLAGQILLSPMLDAGMATCSIRKAHAGPVGCKWADGWRDYLGSPEKASHPYATPAAASRLAGLAPALVLTAEDDPMRDESLCYAGRLRDNGVAVQSRTIPAPTRWPDALDQAMSGDLRWKADVRAAFTAFLAASTQVPPSGNASFRRTRS